MVNEGARHTKGRASRRASSCQAALPRSTHALACCASKRSSSSFTRTTLSVPNCVCAATARAQPLRSRRPTSPALQALQKRLVLQPCLPPGRLAPPQAHRDCMEASASEEHDDTASGPVPPQGVPDRSRRRASPAQLLAANALRRAGSGASVARLKPRAAALLRRGRYIWGGRKTLGRRQTFHLQAGLPGVFSPGAHWSAAFGAPVVLTKRHFGADMPL